MKMQTTLAKDTLKLADTVIRFDEDYQNTGLNGYLKDVFDKLKSGQASSFANPGAKYETKYLSLVNNQSQFKNMNMHYGAQIILTYTVDVDPATEKWVKELDDQLMQNSFWNLSRMIDYIIIQILQNTDETFSISVDDATQDVLDDMSTEWEMAQMNA